MAISDKSLKAYTGDKPFLFMSYCHRDSEEVEPILRALQQRYNVWYDEGIIPASMWAKEIAQRVKKCGYLLALISKNYLESENCLDELEFARDLRRRRLLIFLEDTELPDELKLRHNRRQHIRKNRYNSAEELLGIIAKAEGIERCQASAVPDKKPQPETKPEKDSAAGDAPLQAVKEESGALGENTQKSSPHTLSEDSESDVDLISGNAQGMDTPALYTPEPVVTAELPTAQVAKDRKPTPAPPAPAVTAEPPAAQVVKDKEPAPTPQKPARNGGSTPARVFEYEPCPGGVAITKYKGAGGDVVIPAEIDGQPVVKIAKQAFDYCESLRTVSIPDSVTAIGTSAFNHCTGLLKVKLSAGLTRIGNSAFCECSSLPTITVPDGVESIGQWAFDRCTSLRVLRLPVSLKRIRYAAFRAVGLENVYFTGTSSQWEAITFEERNEAFACAVIHYGDEKVTFPVPGGLLVCKTSHEGVKLIRYNGQGGGVVIPAEIDGKPVVEIGVAAFASFESLTSITIPNSVIRIGPAAFYFCNSLEDVYYFGTVQQWNAVEIKSGNNWLINATIHCRDGVIKGGKPLT